MQKITIDDNRLKYPGFYNIYPIQNEFSMSVRLDKDVVNSELFLDEFYGRIIKNNIKYTYGNSEKLPYYKTSTSNIIEELRVPFRKIPIFEFENLNQIGQLFKEIQKENPDYEILLRGQTKLHTLNRPETENKFLFGNENIKEPSFQPSFVRSNLDEYFIYNLWHSQLALLLNDVGVDLSNILSNSELDSYKKDAYKIKNSPDFTPIALGIAQHYGLPSIGLDFTKTIKVALWFASHTISIDNEGVAKTSSIDNFSESTIYFFRCPKDSVFSHEMIKPKFINNTRPDRQDAWFGHAGWGFAKNQIASYLICGIRLNKDVLSLFEDGYSNFLFPQNDEDLILDYFLNVKKNEKYSGKVKEIFKKLYHTIP